MDLRSQSPGSLLEGADASRTVVGVEVVEIETRRPDVAVEVLNATYGRDRPMAFSGVTDAFSCRLRLTTGSSGLGVDRLGFTAGARTRLAPVDHLLVATGLAGSCRYQVRHEEVDLRPGAVFCHPTDAGLAARWADLDVVALRLPMAVVERVAAEQFGEQGGRDLRFDGVTPVSEPRRRAWTRLSAYAHHQLAEPDPDAQSPLVEARLADLVAATALATFPNWTMRQAHLPGPGYVAPRSVRRATAFIEANAAAPLTVSDVAHAAGTGARALQLAFRQHLQTTPMAYLRRVRIEAAHRELRAADPTAGDSVVATARRWGFARPDRFAAAYRAAYGVSPSHTLRT